MKKITALSLGMVLFSLSCWLAACNRPVSPAPGIPVTGDTAPPGTATAPAVSPLVTPTSTALVPVHGSALSFDGQNDYVIVAQDPSLDLTDSFTIAAWIYLDSYTGWASIVTKGDKPNVNNYALQQSEAVDPVYHTQFGRLRFTGCTTLPVPFPESQTVLPLKTWHFVAVTFDGEQIRFYTDGRPDGSSAVRGPLCINDKPLYIGVDFPLTTEYWHGAIDELQLWNVALSDIQIQSLMSGAQPAADASLVGYWPFDEGLGPIAHDQSPYGNHGQLMGNPTWIKPNSYP